MSVPYTTFCRNIRLSATPKTVSDTYAHVCLVQCIFNLPPKTLRCLHLRLELRLPIPLSFRITGICPAVVTTSHTLILAIIIPFLALPACPQLTSRRAYRPSLRPYLHEYIGNKVKTWAHHRDSQTKSCRRATYHCLRCSTSRKFASYKNFVSPIYHSPSRDDHYIFLLTHSHNNSCHAYCP